MTLNGGIVASVHTTVTFQAFNGLEHGTVGMWFLWAYPWGRRARCARELWVFITRENALLARLIDFYITLLILYISIYYIPSLLTVHFPMTCSVRYQPIFNGLKFTLHRARVLNNGVITTVIEMVEMVERLDGRVGEHSVERVRFVINNLLHLVIVKYGVISLVLCISTRLRLVTIQTLLVKYLVIFHSDPCNKSYI